MVAVSLSDLYALDPVEFEALVGTVFSALGYEVAVTKRSGDEGIDLELRRGDERSLAQCKRYRGTVGQPEIRDFYGVLIHEGASRGYFVTTGQFSLAASTWAQGKQIALTDGVDLLSALENSGVAPAPRVHTRAPQSKSKTLSSIVNTAAKYKKARGRILIDGVPPAGHRYKQISDYLRRQYAGHTPPIRFVDEFDRCGRSEMDQLLDAQDRGSVAVLVATRWEKRLPKAILARFATIIPVAELDWADVDGFPERMRLEAKAKKAAKEEKRRLREERAAQRKLKAEAAEQKRLASLDDLHPMEPSSLGEEAVAASKESPATRNKPSAWSRLLRR